MQTIAALFTSILVLFAGCLPIGGRRPAAQYSQNILLSIDYPGAGMGTRAMCAGADVIVMTDGTIRIEMDDLGFTGTRVFDPIQMTQEDYEKLLQIAKPEKIARLKVRDGEACDGNSRYITLYDQNDEAFLRIGGYMPQGRKFNETYRAIQKILDSYGVGEAVQQWRQKLMDAE
ncbi:MAG: hypothetical protein E7331_12195 [Clostridiales bacterium]|nr:hypothetical protein [Clostridiales bacterium]